MMRRSREEWHGVFQTAQPAQDWDELLALLRILEERLPPHPHILEIGCHRGGTARVWRALQEESRSSDYRPELVSIDWPCEATGDLDGITLIQGLRSQDERAYLRAEAYSPFDFIFIDGGHSYGEVLLDWQWYSPLLRSPDRGGGGGILALHDIRAPDCPGVARFWDELRARDADSAPGSYGCEFLEIAGPTGIGVVLP